MCKEHKQPEHSLEVKKETTNKRKHCIQGSTMPSESQI